MIAKKCDRCGNFYGTYNAKRDEKNTNGLMLLNIDSHQNIYWSHGCIDLCPSCMEKLREFLSNTGTEDNG